LKSKNVIFHEIDLVWSPRNWKNSFVQTLENLVLSP